MRTLIDGYNVMYANGLLGRRLGPDGFRQVRNRFLSDLAGSMTSVEAHLTTVVFDASNHPPDLPSTTSHKGIAVLYAVNSDDADERIEDLIVQHSSPKTLTVVSSDHRIQRAATRRKAKVMSAEDFWVEMDRRKARGKATQEPTQPDRPARVSPAEAAFWHEEFRDVIESEEARATFARSAEFPTDEELARIAREVDEEFRRCPT